MLIQQKTKLIYSFQQLLEGIESKASLWIRGSPQFLQVS